MTPKQFAQELAMRLLVKSNGPIRPYANNAAADASAATQTIHGHFPKFFDEDPSPIDAWDALAEIAEVTALSTPSSDAEAVLIHRIVRIRNIARKALGME